MKISEISIIVPIYQSERYLGRCLDSIANQTFKDIEVILIDVGSTDNSPTICDEIVDRDSRFKVFHRSHAGIVASRNFGLRHSTGRWIAWVDSDDYIDPDYLETMFDACERFHTKMAVARADIDVSMTLSGDMVLKRQLMGELGVLWNTLIAADLYQGKTFPLVLANEDASMLMRITYEVPDAVVIHSEGYHYEIHSDSAVHVLDSVALIGRINGIETRNAYVKKHMPRYYKYVHYTSVVEAAKICRLIRGKSVHGDTNALIQTLKRCLAQHLLKVPLFSLQTFQLKELLSGFKAYLQLSGK